MKKLMAIVLVTALGLAGFAGCGKKEEPVAPTNSSQVEVSSEVTAPTETKTLRIGACPAAAEIAFFQRLASGMEDAGAALGVEVDVQYTDRSIEKELKLTETFIAQSYDGIILETVDSAAITGPLQRAKEAGIPMVAVDTIPDQTQLATCTVTSDNYGGGKAAAELMLEMLPEGGQVIMTKFQYSSRAMDERYKGFEDGIVGSNIEIVEYIEQDGTREDAMKKISSVLSKYPDLKGVFCTQGDPAIGVLSAVDAAGLQDKVVILSYDIEDEVAAAIRQGSAIKGGVTQFPYEMGRRSLVELIGAINGTAPEAEIITIPVLPVTVDNIDELEADSTAFLEKYSDYKVD